MSNEVTKNANLLLLVDEKEFYMTSSEITLFEKVIDELGLDIVNNDNGAYKLKTRRYGDILEIRTNGFNFNFCLFRLVNHPVLEDLRM
jgi:hypothetical protein